MLRVGICSAQWGLRGGCRGRAEAEAGFGFECSTMACGLGIIYESADM